MDQRMSIITLGVQSLPDSMAFYKRVFGWEPLPAMKDPPTIAFYQMMNGFQLSLFPLEEMKKEHSGAVGSPTGFTMAYTVNSEKEVDDLFNHFKECKVTILKEPEKVFWGGYSGYISGPDGENWEIAYNPYTLVNDDGTFGSVADAQPSSGKEAGKKRDLDALT